MTDREQIEKLYRDYWQYMIDKDVKAMDAIMTDGYTLTHMTGLKQKKRDFFDSVLSGELNYYSAVHDEIKVSVSGGRAEMTAKSRVEAAVYGGRKSRWRLRGDFTLSREDGVWKLSSSRASTY